MFLIRSTRNPPGPTLNALIPFPQDRAARQARRVVLCQRLGDLAMELAEATQREALRELQPRPERRPPGPGEYRPPAPPTFHSTALTENFATLSRCVRQAILLEARLDSGAYDRPPPERTIPTATAESPAQPRTQKPGDGTSLHHETLEDDPLCEDHRGAEEILIEIADKLGQALNHPQAPAQPLRAAANAPHPNGPHRNPRNPPKPPHPPEQRPPPKPA